MIEHAPQVWLVLCLAALVVGFAKTAIGGLGTVAVAMYAAVLPARESTAALLLLLLVGDVVAVSKYRRDCDWGLLRHLIPGVLPGLAVGAVVLALVDDLTLRRGIGVVILVLVVLQLVLSRRRNLDAPSSGWPRPARVGSGIAAGFTTMVANAGGPVMTLYLVGQGIDKRRFLGTTAWFFFGVNLCKLPFSAGLGLFDTEMLWTALVLAPLVLVGAFVGIRVAGRMRQSSFDLAVLTASALSALALIAA
ncbi:Sulfite exporter TauE/SafE [metagenome]|uniref:Sulfite exporter TauE/SafE n=1 Tax=metagenome TaxID=256318 RepID=A0A2P2CFT4_9ZZZZ